jgi:hypothetical protein
MLAVKDTVKNNKPIHIWSDSAALIGAWERAQRWGPQHKNKWDGLLKQQILSVETQHRAQVCFHKVKAHRHLKDAESQEDRMRILGNMAADHMANKSISDHTEEYHGNKAIAYCKGIRQGTKDMVSLLDRARTATGVPPKPTRNVRSWARKNRSNGRGSMPHSIRWGTGAFHCENCFRRFRTLPPPGQPCSEAPRAIRGIVESARVLGHTPVIFLLEGRKPGVLAACTICAAYTMDMYRNLGVRCPKGCGTRGNASKRLARGLHPTCDDTRVVRRMHWSSIKQCFEDSAGARSPTTVTTAPRKWAEDSTGQGVSEAYSTVTTAPRKREDVLSQEEEDCDEWDSAAFAEFFGEA